MHCAQKAWRISAWAWRPRHVSSVSRLHGSSLFCSSRSCYSSLTTPSCDDAPKEPGIVYNWVDGEATIEHYQPGGYHPVMIDDVLHKRYQIVDKLGYGGYSTVWLAHDTNSKHYVALKVGIADSPSEKTNHLRGIAQCPGSSNEHPGRDAIPLPLDEFEISGPNGTHHCYTMSPAQCNLREVSFSRLFPLEVTRALWFRLAQAIAYTHLQGYAHGGLSPHSLKSAGQSLTISLNTSRLDVHLGNILVKLPSSLDQLSVEQFYETYDEPETWEITRRDGKPLSPNVPAKAVVPLYLGKGAEKFTLSDTCIILSDFGESFNPTSNSRKGKDCHTPLASRPPEARFQPKVPLSFSADIWSLGACIWEILGMRVIFSSDWYSADEVTCQHIDILGPLPQNWWEQWSERGKFFDVNGRPTEGRYVWPPIEQAFEEDIQEYRRKRDVGEYDKEETAAILDLMRRMFAYPPEDRPTAEEVLKSEWMVKIVLA
ncbi:unnamed protein product [Penicillium salamii]|uniref:non-specific serine/threonine protein kinase n=1 Tax=Penicillium salamii TaxID=1612424 RepID=A0A9W4J4R0_9EURO|nr:unnamed protein product [Penicillium salamii]CAG8009390.1 unnamed protein product [Penicillium salamii]CAG8022752.1 unnamed protein product [Penicillium salamii]CAG8118952.1 unnamed protein product [Penicillium salamii]CAG8144878.1 unnamed protein product [Penicillium salamii]